MTSCLRWLCACFLLSVLWSGVQAQTITTDILSVSSVCPGSTLDVQFTTDSQYNSGNAFTVELSDGGGYKSIPTGSAVVVQTNRVVAIWKATATIPASTSAGTAYRVRVTATNPAVTGSPSSTTLTVKSVSPVPAASAITYCQGTSASSLSATTATNGVLTWYTAVSGVTGSAVAPIPSTTSSGTATYYVSQTIPGACESQRIALPVTVNSTPASPGVTSSNLSFCQAAPVQSLTASGQNLKWYDVASGGTSTTSVTPNTVSAGNKTYYVSQTVNGCESSRTAIAVTVNALPGVPIVSATGPVYCQNNMAVPLQANGQNLNWYRQSSGGTSLGSSITPRTDTSGNFTYYVSQTINGCEGSRSSITVSVKAKPLPPFVTNVYAYCQKTVAPALTANGTGLKWIDSLKVSYGTAPVPSTDVPGTFIYYVVQTVDGCESDGAQIKVIVKPTPGAPATTPIVVCQNGSTQALSANGQNLKWYATSTGGESTTATPTLNTTQAGQVNYYVSQTLDGCEGPRSSLTVTIKPLPSLPGVTAKSVCQFATADPVSAVGLDLKWYSTDGTKYPSAPVPTTDKPGSLTYLVTQTVDGCESPKASLTVAIQTTPSPTVAKTIVEICQGTTASPLEATGTSLKWTDPNGNVTTTTPTPPTLNATTKPDGDVYYVTQTGTNGCESPKVAIRVFVQTTPTLSISGTTTSNLGLEVPLKLTFTGVGPYRFKLTDGTSGTCLKDTTILVLPTRTTTYQVAEVANKCGTGQPGNGATATITVSIPRIQTLGFTTTTLCAGASLTTRFLTIGTFNPGSVFKLQFAKVETDSTKATFTDFLGTQALNGEISGTIPTNAVAGTYWVRVMATNPKIPINGNFSPTVLTIRSLPSATLTGNQTIYEGQPASLSVVFAGDGPWSFSYRDSTTALGTVRTVATNANPHVLEVRPAKTASYALTSVSNNCGVGTSASRRVIVTVIPLLAIEDQSLDASVQVYPVPAATSLTVQIHGLTTTEPALLELTDLTGRTTLRRETRQATSILPLDQHPAGIYVLHIQVGDRRASKRILVSQ